MIKNDALSISKKRRNLKKIMVMVRERKTQPLPFPPRPSFAQEIANYTISRVKFIEQEYYEMAKIIAIVVFMIKITTNNRVALVRGGRHGLIRLDQGNPNQC